MAKSNKNLPQYDGTAPAKGLDFLFATGNCPAPSKVNTPDNHSVEESTVTTTSVKPQKKRNNKKASAPAIEGITKTSLYITTAMLKDLKYLAIESNLNVNACIIDAITSYLHKARKSRSENVVTSKSYEGSEPESDEVKTL